MIDKLVDCEWSIEDCFEQFEYNMVQNINLKHWFWEQYSESIHWY